MAAQRGRKSAVSETIPAIGLVSTRKTPAPPIGLSDASADLWDSITKSLPADFFRPGDLPLLESYCVSHDRKRKLDALVLAHGVFFDGEVHPAMKASRDEAGIMASLAVKLRLCQSSRTRPDAAGLKDAATGPKPWEPRDDG